MYINTHSKQIRAIDSILEGVSNQHDTHKANEVRKARLKGQREAFAETALRGLPSKARDQALVAEKQIGEFLDKNFGYVKVSGGKPEGHIMGDDGGANAALKNFSKEHPLNVRVARPDLSGNPMAKKINELRSKRGT